MTEFEYFSKSDEEKAIINNKIKESIDVGLQLGELTKEVDFYFSESGDEMIEVTDQNDNDIIYNYTKSKIESILKINI